MKTYFLILAAVLASLAFTGCVFMNDEDKAFYGKGWVHPSELDDVPPRRAPATTAATSDYRPAETAVARPQQPAPEWITPETSDNVQ